MGEKEKNHGGMQMKGEECAREMERGKIRARGFEF